MLVTAAAQGQAFAQSNSPADSSGSGAEIVVTATKRSESIQKVPASVTAIGGEALTQNRITLPTDLVSLVPNLQSTATSGEGEATYALRGIALNDFSTNQQGPIAIYYDEVYKGVRPFQGVNLFDMERVEVLRGPQGTLYGQNASGGAINFISKKPVFDTEGSMSMGYGNYARFEGSGMFNTAITDTLAMRVAGTFANANGWMKNVIPGQPNPSSTDYVAGRLSFLFQPSDKVNVLLRGSYSKMNGTNYGNIAQITNPADAPETCLFGFIGAGVGAGCGLNGPYTRDGLGKYEVASNYVPRYRKTSYAVSLTANVQLSDSLSLVSISSYDRGTVRAPQDGDGTPFQTFEVTATDSKANQIAQDLRLVSDFSGPFNFILGGYYGREKSYNENGYVIYGDLGPTCDGSVGCLQFDSFNQKKSTIAAYSDASYKLGDVVTLRAGVRFTHDKGRVSNYTGGYYNIGDGAPFSVGLDNATAGYEGDHITGKVGADFQLTSDIMLYASYSTGFRSAAFSMTAVSDPSQIIPSPAEKVQSIEAGFKTQWFDRRLTLNGALFHYGYKNQQSIRLDNGIATLYGIPQSRLYGAELELTARPVDGIRINGGLGYTHSETREGVVDGVDLKGLSLPLVSKWSGNLGVEWDVAKGSFGTVTAAANTNYVSKVYFDIFNTERGAQDGYALLNGTLRWRSDNDRFGVTVWGRNLTNKYYFTANFATAKFQGADTGSLGTPRTYGATFDVKF